MSTEKFTSKFAVNFGANIVPIKRIEIFSPEEWEEFTSEWLGLKKKSYCEIERLGGANDKGRDVVAYITNKHNPNYSWDCYQCKHYDKPLYPTDVYVEIAKIIYYSSIFEYPIPKNYYFVAPKGCGTSLSKLLQNPTEFKKSLISSWNTHCKDKVSKNLSIELKDNFLKYLNSFDFSIFKKINIKNVIEEHRLHPNHIIRFGGGLPERPKLDKASISTKVEKYEIVYTKQLLLSYSSEANKKFITADDINSIEQYSHHFNRSRINFHYAEQLRNFYRDSLPTNTFEDFQEEIYDGIIDIVEDFHDNALKKIKEVEKQASNLQITSNPITAVSVISDRKGICHQLVNNKKIKWIDE
ncbi:ABC-three component system protein [Chryseobacterium sp. R2ACT005]|uniref:ABC-three component system protein n=1 Tax=Chryseobacterium sp. R2ACT005 TaxID=3416668 RepID=UPI003CE85ADE